MPQRILASRSLPVLVATALVALCVPQRSLAQANTRLVGFKVGVATTSTEAIFTPAVEGESATGLTVGGFGRLPIGSAFALQAELLLIRKGTNFQDFEVRSTVLQVPVTLQYLLPIGGMGLRAYGGPSVGLPIGCSPDQFTVTTGFGDFTTDQTLTGCPIGSDELRTGVVAGGLLDVSLGSTVLTLDVRYGFGLSELQGRDYVVFPGTLNFPNFEGFRGFEITTGLGFPVRWSGRR